MTKKNIYFLEISKIFCLGLFFSVTAVLASENNQLANPDWGPQYTYPKYIATKEQQDEWRKAARKYALPKEIKAQLRKKDFRTKDYFLAYDSPYLVSTNSASFTSLPEVIALKFFMYDKGEQIDRLCNAERLRIVIKNNGLDRTFVIPQKWFHYVRGMWRVLAGNIKLIPLREVNTVQIKDMIKLAELSGYRDWIGNMHSTVDGRIAIIDTEDLSFCCNKMRIDSFHLYEFSPKVSGGVNDYPWNCRAMLALNTLLLGHIEQSAREEAEAYVKTLFTQSEACEEIVTLPWQKSQDTHIDWSLLRISQHSQWEEVSSVDERMQNLLNAENNKNDSL